MKRPISVPSDSRPMSRRAAQALSAIVFLASRNKGQTPNIVPLGSLLVTRRWQRAKVDNPDGRGWRWGWELDPDIGKIHRQRKAARHWLDFFRNQGNEYFYDAVGPESKNEFVNSDKLATTREEVICLLALYNTLRKNGNKATISGLEPGIIDILRNKGYVKNILFFNGLILTEKTLHQLPYLRLLARNFQSLRRKTRT